jgi:hypothetical protein
MNTFTKIVIAAALSMTATSSFSAERMGKCISHDGNVFDCIIAVPDHQAKAQRNLNGGHADERTSSISRSTAPTSPDGTGGGTGGGGGGIFEAGPGLGGFDFGGRGGVDLGGIDLGIEAPRF